MISLTLKKKIGFLLKQNFKKWNSHKNVDHYLHAPTVLGKITQKVANSHL